MVLPPNSRRQGHATRRRRARFVYRAYSCAYGQARRVVVFTMATTVAAIPVTDSQAAVSPGDVAGVRTSGDRLGRLGGIFAAAGVVTAILLLAKAAGFGEKILVAHALGTTRSADCYYAAYAVTWTLVMLATELVQGSCLPVYVGMLQSGRAGLPDRLVTVMGVLLAAGMLACTAVLALWPEAASAVIVPGFDAAAKAEAGGLIRAMSAGTGILGLSALTRMLLNAHRRFGWAAMGDLVFRATYVGLFGLGWAVRGGNRVGSALAAAAALALLAHVGALRKQIRVRLSRPDGELIAALRQVALLAMPLTVGVVSSHAGQMIDGMLASVLPAGRLSALVYARKLTDAIVLLGPAGLATVTFSHFAALAAAGEQGRMRRQLWRCAGIVLAAAVPIAVLVVVLREPTVRVLFERGRFDATSTRLTATALAWYAMGIPALALEGLIVTTFYACGDTRTPVVAGVAATAGHVLLACLLMPSLGYLAIAAATPIAKTIKVTVLGMLVHRSCRPTP